MTNNDKISRLISAGVLFKLMDYPSTKIFTGMTGIYCTAGIQSLKGTTFNVYPDDTEETLGKRLDKRIVLLDEYNDYVSACKPTEYIVGILKEFDIEKG